MATLLVFAFSSLGRIVLMVVAVGALLGGLYLKGWIARGTHEKAKQAEETLNNLRDRNKTDDTINKLPPSDLDDELGRWVPND